MAGQSKKSTNFPEGYPKHDQVVRGCQIIAQKRPPPVFVTCSARIHNPSQRVRAALLQVFKINSLAAAGMLRDIEQHHPEQLFQAYRKRNSTHFLSDGIADAIGKRYREHIRSRYTLNSYLFGGLCTTLAAQVSGYLHSFTKARQTGAIQRYEQSAAHVVSIGKYRGKALGSLGRKTIAGYAFLMPQRSELEEARGYLALLQSGDKADEGWEQAQQYRMPFGPRKGRPLGSVRPETLRRLVLLVQRDLERADELESLRKAAQTYLRFTPPGFPHVGSDGLSATRRRELQELHRLAEEDFAALPDLADDQLNEHNLMSEEYQHFRELQRSAYAATSQPRYVPLRWGRADGCTRHRECALVYDPAKRRYLFLAYLLPEGSRHRRTLAVKRELYDVNNPTVKLVASRRPSGAMLFELEFDTHQQQLLDRARQESMQWKDKPDSSSGCIRAATLHAHYSEEQHEWWFEVQLSVGFKPAQVEQPEHIVGVHVDPAEGLFVTVLDTDGSQQVAFHLDEAAIALWLKNKDPAFQAQLKPDQRTAKERAHRVADALAAICKHYKAQLAVEDISYRRHSGQPRFSGVRNDNSRSVKELLHYKLALAGLPDAFDIKGVAPRRDCGQCGKRHSRSVLQGTTFVCSTCEHSENRHSNAAREVARRGLWILARKTASQRKAKSVDQATAE